MVIHALGHKYTAIEMAYCLHVAAETAVLVVYKAEDNLSQFSLELTLCHNTLRFDY
jgi:hypothetical protein